MSKPVRCKFPECEMVLKDEKCFRKHFKSRHEPTLVGVSAVDLKVMLGLENKYVSGSEADCMYVFDYRDSPVPSPPPSPEAKRAKKRATKQQLNEAILELSECAYSVFDTSKDNSPKATKEDLEKFKEEMLEILRNASKLFSANFEKSDNN